MSIRIYLAAQFNLRYSLHPVRRQLQEHGIIVHADWLDSPGGDLADPATQAWIERDLSDLQAADVFVALSLPSQHGWGSGGRHVEFGYALALNKPIVLVGKQENLFHWHESVIVASDVRALPEACERALRLKTVDSLTTTSSFAK